MHPINALQSPKFLAYAALSMLLPALGYAQLAPEPPSRLYFGVNRPIPFKVTLPESVPQDKPGEVRIDLFDPAKSEPEATAPVLPGTVDLSTLFPVLWRGATPKLRYAQLVVAGEQVGPPVVLQPLLSPPMAKFVRTTTRNISTTGTPNVQVIREVYFNDPDTKHDNFDPRDGEIIWVTEPPAYSGIRAYIDQHVVFETSLGEIEFRLRPDAAPNTAFNFRDLAEHGFYTDIIFHRIVPFTKNSNGQPFVIQVGDPTGTGDGGPGYNIDLERSTLPHDYGVLSMARSTDPDTNGSQVFIALARETTARLDGRYTAFAQAVRGAETITALTNVKVTDDRPNDPPVLRSARLEPAPPYSKRAMPLTRPSEKPRQR